MKLKNIVASIVSLFGIGAIAIASTSAFAQPNPNEVFIRQISYRGTGCPGGTVDHNISLDARAFTLLFDSFVAEAGPGIPLSSGRRNCQLLIDLQFPQGWSYSIATLDYRGYANLEPGTQGEQSATYYFQGSGTSIPLRTTMYGPIAQDYQFRDQLGLSAQIWSQCGASRALNINTAVAVRAPRGRQALMTVDSINGEVKQVYGIQWRRCQ